MGFFSFLGTKKQESAGEAAGFTSRSEEESRAHRNRSSRSKKQPDGGASASADTALPEKKRARRRLIGAIALVLAAIIGLPMLLDSEQKPVPDDIAIEIPSQDIPAVPVAPVVPIAPVVPVAPAGASSSGSVSAAAGLGREEEIIDPAPAIVPAPVIAAAPSPTLEVRPAPKPEPKLRPKLEPKSKPEPKPEPPRAAAKADEGARARAILEGRVVAAAAPDQASSKFALQIAALTTQEKVDELQLKLRNAGIKSYSQKVTTKSGAPVRVRVGPFASRDEAEKMHAKLVQLGFGGTIVPLN